MLGLDCGLRSILTSRGWSRSVPAPHRIPFRPSSGAPGPKACRSRHRTGVHRSPHRTDARARLQEEISRNLAVTVRAGGRRLRTSAFEQMVADALDEIPPELGDGDGQRRGGRRGVADAAEQLRASRPAARCSGSTKACRSPQRGPVSYAGVAPDRITIFRGPLSRLARDDDDLAAQRTGRPCCTRSATTSA